LVYVKPAGYINMRFYFPFSVVSRSVGGVQKFYAAAGPLTDNTWDVLCGNCNPNLPSYYGQEITHIDYIPILDWLLAFGKKAGIYVDAGVQMNNILSSLKYGFSLGLHEAPSANTLVYTVGGANATFDYIFQYSQQPSSISVVEGYNHYIAPGSRARSVASDGFGHNSVAEIERSMIETLEKVILSKRSARDATSVRLMKNAQRHVQVLRATQAASDAYGVRLAEASTKRDFSMERFLASNRVPFVHERLRAVDAAIVAIMDLEAVFDREASDAQTRRVIDASVETKDVTQVSSKKNAAAAIETELVTGDAQSLQIITAELNAGVARYNNSLILKLKAFDITQSNDFLNALRQVHTLRPTYNTQELIIDVSGNGGGIVCLNYVTLAFLVEQWRGHATFGSDVLYSPYDWRLSPLNNALWNNDRNGVFGGEVDPATGAPLGASVHDAPRTVTYGAHTSQYSKFFNWDLCPSDYFETDTVAALRAFDKIIVLTDGTCGSSCAYFLSHLRSTDKVRVVSYGGANGLPLATSSFAGGNVYQYDAIVRGAIEGGYQTAANIHYMDHNAVTTFNFRANYHTNEQIPRQFKREEADWHVSYWDALGVDVYDTLNPSPTNRQIMANLYASVTPLFSQMPASLARVTLPPSAPVDTSAASGFSPLFATSALLALLLALIF